MQIQPVNANWDIKAIDDFIERITLDKADHFLVEYIPKENNKDVFELYSKNGRIILRGNNGLSIGSALNYYLKHYCKYLVTWNMEYKKLPAVLPEVKEKIHKASPYRYRYYLNYCTFNYSMAWWDWERWQKEIDWMTLNGINMPLALTGEESIWNKVYIQMGFSNEQLDKFFCGPSYFAWFWMGNLDAWGGPLSQNWMDKQEALQKKILHAERSMGMTPILPAFTGHVPPSFHDKFPKAKVKKTNWNSGFDDVLILDPSDPMFEVIGKKFLEMQTKNYGTDHFYSADTFNENIPPSNDSLFLNDISKKVYRSMAATDPHAVWIMQGWMFHYQSFFWGPAQIKALLNAVPDDRMIILDLFSESYPVWVNTDAYYGKPWIWNMLHNFGGNVSMWGRMDPPATKPASNLVNDSSGQMVGIGLTPEAIEQNPILYHLMLENVWTDKPIDIDQWLKNYVTYRYGKSDTKLEKAWPILANSVYEGGLTEGGPESIITGRPTLDSAGKWTRTQLGYDPSAIIRAWELFIGAAPDLKESEGYRYDLVDITRQVLANYADTLHHRFAKAYKSGDRKKFLEHKTSYLALLDDMDKLLATRKGFLLGKWLEDARSHGITEKEKDLYEFNARDLITLWGNKESPLHDYSCRQWSGLIKGFYKPRWEKFINYLDEALQKNKKADLDKFETIIKDWEWQWVNGHEKYSSQPTGDPIRTAIDIYKKYIDEIELSYQLSI